MSFEDATKDHVPQRSPAPEQILSFVDHHRLRRLEIDERTTMSIIDTKIGVSRSASVRMERDGQALVGARTPYGVKREVKKCGKSLV